MYYISNYTAIDYSAYAMLHIKHVPGTEVWTPRWA